MTTESVKVSWGRRDFSSVTCTAIVEQGDDDMCRYYAKSPSGEWWQLSKGERGGIRFAGYRVKNWKQTGKLDRAWAGTPVDHAAVAKNGGVYVQGSLWVSFGNGFHPMDDDEVRALAREQWGSTVQFDEEAFISWPTLDEKEADCVKTDSSHY